MSQHTSSLFPRPTEGDCPEYYFKYIDTVPDVDISTLLHTQRDWFGDWIEGLTPEQLQSRYAPEKWSLAELIGHVLDTERVFSYRMHAFTRNDQNKLPGFEQDEYVRDSNYNQIPAADLANEWRAIRSSSIYQTRHLNEEMASRVGTANNVQFRASAFPYIMAGHVIHHYRIAQEKYVGTPVFE
jgi:hypothetical protein